MNEQNPLRIYCRNCGAPISFDIIRQTYACRSCGELTGIEEAKETVYYWRKMQKRNLALQSGSFRLEEHSCPACGAHVVFNNEEASRTCDFCGSSLIRRELTSPEQMPELIIPFFITPQEARKRMLQWGQEHEKSPEGRSIVSSMNQFRGYYLPYQLVRGPVYGTVTRDGNSRTYRCAGYLEGTAVNTSRQMDNLVLNEIEPFDWSAVRPFEYGYIAGHNVKLSDISQEDTNSRIEKEAEADFLDDVEKVMQSSGVCVQVETGNISAIPVLLPVYFIKSGKLTAVMNGQTGRIAASKERKKKSNPWMIEPLLYTIIAAILSGFFFQFAVYPMVLSGFVAACIFFSVMGDGRKSLIRRITLVSGASRASRKKGKLIIEEERGKLKNHRDNTPVFYEKNMEGKVVPVQIHFYSIRRWIFIIVNVFLTVFLPALLAVPLRWIVMEPGETFMEGYRLEYGAVWYVLAGFLAVLYLTKGIRRDVYDHPILYELLPDGKKRLIGKHSERRVSILSVFESGQIEKSQQKLPLFQLVGTMGGIGIFLAAVFLIALVGSILAIL